MIAICVPVTATSTEAANSDPNARVDTIDVGDLMLGQEPAGSTDAATEPPATSYQHFKEGEREKILAALDACGWNRAKAARMLGIPRRTFYRRLREHGIALPADRD